VEKNAMLTRRRGENEEEATRKKEQMMGHVMSFFFLIARHSFIYPGDAVTFTLVDRELDTAARWWQTTCDTTAKARYWND